VTPDGLVEGFCTALMHMHKGDRWIVHIPYKLGYGTSTSSGIRAYSDLTFDIAVLEIWPQGEEMEQFKSR
jgi:FKBP-type peptidyl-prolyl cis-trans isomerase FklB